MLGCLQDVPEVKPRGTVDDDGTEWKGLFHVCLIQVWK